MTPLDTAAAPTTSENAESGTTDSDNIIHLGTRFGTFEIDLAKTVWMPQGPLGFTDLQKFAVLDAPDSPDSPFKLFQSIEDKGVTFVVTPLPPASELISEEDLRAACMSYSIARENAAFLLITKIRRDNDGNPITSVNLRAPILVDMVNLVARQVVFSGDTYPMQLQIQGVPEQDVEQESDRFAE